MTGIRQSRQVTKLKELIEAATHFFLMKGYAATSVDEIVGRAGGTKTNVYKLVGDKQELLRRVVAEQLATFDLALPTTTATQAPADYLRRAGRHVAGVLFSKSSIQLHRLVIAEGRNDKAVANRYIKHCLGPVVDNLAAYFSVIAKGSGQPAVPPRRLAQVFVSALLGEPLLRLMATGGPAPSAREVGKHVDDVVACFAPGLPSQKR